MSKFQFGDKVRIKEASLVIDKQVHTVRTVMTTRIGCPCWLETPDGQMRTYPYPEDTLVLVRKTTEDPRDRRIRELEERVEKLEIRLGLRL
jgi:hypothetical protein